ncbi:MAG: transglycosylase domain-containing protein [Microscillaceae bacterium]|nr:transglycosylase domain-containing protein [Microscillaceae bacterium]MDW8461937.1 transglycosylase domain-containing protein [Cytophagales bacterium]
MVLFDRFIIKKGKFFNLIVGIWITFFLIPIGIILYFVALNYNLFGLFGKLPSLENLENPKNELASEIYTSDGVLMGKYYRENRTPVQFEEISPYLINALIATEDIRFEQHSGIDLRGLSRAIYGLITGDNSGGGSTLSQQLAKNLFKLRKEGGYRGYLHKVPILKTIVTKTKEWLVAVKLERSYTKKEIITLYLNTVEFGSNAFGIQTAAKTFFDKDPSQLNVEEAAVLVGVLQAPTKWSPFLNKKNAIFRRNVVLEQMHKYGFLGSSQLAYYKSLPLVTKRGVEDAITGIAPYLRAEAQKFLLEWAKENGRDLYADGLRIFTTIDSRVQKIAEEAMIEHMKYQQKLFYAHWQGIGEPWRDEFFRVIPDFIENEAKKTPRYKALVEEYGNDTKAIEAEMNKKISMRIFTWEGERDTLMSPMDSIRHYKWFLQAGFMAMEPKTGHIKAWVGGIDFKHFQYDHVKLGKRQPGSTFKPIVYVAALDNGYTPCNLFIDQPVTFKGGAGGKDYTPRNSYGGYTYATKTMRQALGESINSITAAITKLIGVKTIVDYARMLGITSPLDPVASLCLGSSDVSLYELVGAYATFANKGRYIKPMFITRIEDYNGRVIADFTPEVSEVVSEEVAYMMLDMLKASTEPGGTAVALANYGLLTKDNEIGAKTGTTQNQSDAWFIGVTRDLVAGVWVGGDSRSIHYRDISLGQGAVLALPMYGRFMQKIYADPSLPYKRCFFDKPEELSVELNCGAMAVRPK